MPVSGYLAHHPHAFDVVTRQDLNLRRPLQKLLRFRDACKGKDKTSRRHLPSEANQPSASARLSGLTDGHPLGDLVPTDD